MNFAELYARHLCRHSQFGINVSHLATVVGSYVGVFAIVQWLAGVTWVGWAIAGLYLISLTFHLPGRVLVATAVFVGVFLAVFRFLPTLPIWFAPVLIVLSHQVQNWSHKIWSKGRDMSAFALKYPKGPRLFALLSLYELPILLNYLLFDHEYRVA